MTTDCITADNASRELIRSIFEAAFVEFEIDSDGDVVVKEDVNVYVMPNPEKKYIRLLTQFGFKPSVSTTQKLEAANKINEQYLFVRASVIGDRLRFSYDISLDAGVLKKALVLIVKRFSGIPLLAVRDHAMDIIV